LGPSWQDEFHCSEMLCSSAAPVEFSATPHCPASEQAAVTTTQSASWEHALLLSTALCACVWSEPQSADPPAAHPTPIRDSARTIALMINHRLSRSPATRSLHPCPIPTSLAHN